jgi:hypothetical protein
MKLPKAIQQLALLVKNTITLRKLILNRFAILAIVLLLANFALVQPLVAANNDGQIGGTVVDESGDPIENATVHIQKLELKSQDPYETTTTGSNGQFMFTNKTDFIEFRIYAETEQGQQSEIQQHHLYFRGQNKMDIKLVIERSG